MASKRHALVDRSEADAHPRGAGGPTEAQSPKAPYHRAPRRAEVDFLLELMSQPGIPDRGPLGRCLKRGWCEKVPAATGDTWHYEVSSEGRRIVEASEDRKRSRSRS